MIAANGPGDRGRLRTTQRRGAVPVSALQRAAVSLLALLLLTIVVGCGGGTRGTGDTGTLLIGSVKDVAGAPIAAATVSQLETGEQAATNENGEFTLLVEPENGEATLLIEGAGFEAQTVVSGISAEPGSEPVAIAITVDKVSGIVTDVEIDAAAPQPTPTPVQTPGGGGDDTDSPSAERIVHRIDGLVVNNLNAPLRGIRFTAPGARQAESNGAGRFTLKVKASSSTIVVGVFDGSVRGSFRLTGLPTDRAAAVSVTVKITTPPGPAFDENQAPGIKVDVTDVSIQ